MTAAARRSRVVRVGKVEVGNGLPLAFIAGPCQIESRAHALEIAARARARWRRRPACR